MQGIVPEKNQRRIFDQLIQGGLDVVVKEGEVCLIELHLCKNNVCRTEHSCFMNCMRYAARHFALSIS